MAVDRDHCCGRFEHRLFRVRNAGQGELALSQPAAQREDSILAREDEPGQRCGQAPALDGPDEPRLLDGGTAILGTTELTSAAPAARAPSRAVAMAPDVRAVPSAVAQDARRETSVVAQDFRGETSVVAQEVAVAQDSASVVEQDFSPACILVAAVRSMNSGIVRASTSRMRASRFVMERESRP
jgi:hypothetical protein